VERYNDQNLEKVCSTGVGSSSLIEARVLKRTPCFKIKNLNH
jgi:galactitol-specific phosphotransferase system IIB component